MTTPETVLKPIFPYGQYSKTKQNKSVAFIIQNNPKYFQWLATTDYWQTTDLYRQMCELGILEEDHFSIAPRWKTVCEKLGIEQEKDNCIFCLEEYKEKVRLAFFPCLHAVVCLACKSKATGVEKCWKCQKPCVSLVKVYLS